MRIRYGFRMTLECAQPTPATFAVDVHSSRHHDIIVQSPMFMRTGGGETLTTSTSLDAFGNIRRRVLLPEGRIEIENHGVVHDPGTSDVVNVGARQSALEGLPEDVMVFLFGSRYCETDLLAAEAWRLFGTVPEGWPRVQAICDFVHENVEFGYQYADCTRSATGVLRERRGVCRDFAHLSIALCRAMNIPARYCTGYLGDIGVPRDPAPMDFSAWFEAYLDGRWYSFDARHNIPRVGRVVMARGRDATDVPIVCTFGQHKLVDFEVWTDEMAASRAVAA